jgi:hypothetical protein
MLQTCGPEMRVRADAVDSPLEDLVSRYGRIDRLLRRRAKDFPGRVEPTWSRLEDELGEVAALLRARAMRGSAAPPRLDEELLARPVFVVGYPKSGTTLVLALLDGHPQLAVIPGETRWFTDPPRSLGELHERWIRYLVNPSGQDPFWLLGRPAEAHDPYLAFSNDLYALARAHPELDPLTLLAALFASRAPAARAWVEKTPLHLFELNRIRSRFPSARFVHVVRDPLSTVAAIQQFAQHGWRTDLDETTSGVAAALGLASRLSRKLGGDTYLVVRYEDVVRAPADELRRVAEFIGIDVSDSLLHPTLAGVPVRANSAWLERRVLGEIHDRSLAPAAAGLDTRTLALVHARASKPARALGYDVPRVGLARAASIEAAERLRRLTAAVRARRKGSV